jgi:hypothetical protein
MPFTRVLTKSLKYAGIWAPMWSKVDYGGVKWRAQLHIYLSNYKYVVISSKLVVYILIDMSYNML